jgi:biopolymer transport protein ExbB
LAQAAESGEEAVADTEAASDTEARLREAEQRAEAALADEPSVQAEEAETPVPAEPREKIDMLNLLLKGRWLMLPIALMSLMVVAVGAERFLGLRRRKILPRRLISGLTEMAGKPEALDPRKAFQLCRRYPSTAATVIEAMLLKVGRRLTELEAAANQASHREADRLHANVRWLNLAAGVTPLLGLLGTVWGMIQAFFETANLPVEANRAQMLADGIWTALVTTFAGLAVAIPAAILAHLYEGRIKKLFRQLDETLLLLTPRLERYEGRLRLTREQLLQADSRPIATLVAKEGKRRTPTASPK